MICQYIDMSVYCWKVGMNDTDGLVDVITVGYDKNNKKHHMLLLCLLMTSCDLSDQTKNWRNTKKIAVRPPSHVLPLKMTLDAVKA